MAKSKVKKRVGVAGALPCSQAMLMVLQFHRQPPVVVHVRNWYEVTEILPRIIYCCQPAVW